MLCFRRLTSRPLPVRRGGWLRSLPAEACPSLCNSSSRAGVRRQGPCSGAGSLRRDHTGIQNASKGLSVAEIGGFPDVIRIQLGGVSARRSRDGQSDATDTKGKQFEHRYRSESARPFPLGNDQRGFQIVGNIQQTDRLWSAIRCPGGSLLITRHFGFSLLLFIPLPRDRSPAGRATYRLLTTDRPNQSRGGGNSLPNFPLLPLCAGTMAWSASGDSPEKVITYPE